MERSRERDRKSVEGNQQKPILVEEWKGVRNDRGNQSKQVTKCRWNYSDSIRDLGGYNKRDKDCVTERNVVEGECHVPNKNSTGIIRRFAII